MSDEHGKSVIHKDNKVYSINSKNQLFVYHTLPEIQSMEPNLGGNNGKTHLKIRGNSFDAYPGKTKVMVGDQECKIVDISSSELTCLTPSKDSVGSAVGGPRGLLYEAWVRTEASFDDESSDPLLSSASDYRKKVVDSSTIQGKEFDDQIRGFTARLSGLFVAPYTGRIAFYLHCSSRCRLQWSNNTDTEQLETLLYWKNGKTKQGVGNTGARSRAIEVVKGEEYYIEALQTQSEDDDDEIFLQIAMWEYETIYHEKHSKNIVDERQVLRLSYTRVLETQRITVNGVVGESEVIFTQSGKDAPDAFPLALEDANSTWEEKFKNMLVRKCNFIRGRSLYKNDYENVNYHLPGAGGTMNDQLTPFCGNRVLERQTRLMHRYGKSLIDANQFKYLCFAVKGKVLKGILQLLVSWQRDDNRLMRDWVYLSNMWEPSEEWQYKCWNWDELLRNSEVSGLKRMKEGSTYLKIEDILTPVEDGDRYWYHDEFSITEEEVELTIDFGAVPSEDVQLENVEVNFINDTSSFDVVLRPETCNEEKDDFALFGVKDADIVGLDLSSLNPADKEIAIQNYLKTNDDVTFTKPTWGGGTININRQKRGSRGLTGTYTLSHKGKSTGKLWPQISELDFKNALENDLGLTGIRAWYWGQSCWSWHIVYAFRDTSIGGDVETLTMDTSELVADNGNEWKGMGNLGNTNGGAFIEAPGGDFFRLRIQEQHVTVFVNDFLASCSSNCLEKDEVCTKNCLFQYKDELTPILTSVSHSTNSQGKVELSFVGQNFPMQTNVYKIDIGEHKCNVFEATKTAVKCSLEPGPAGTYEISFITLNSGEATQPNSGTLTYDAALNIIGISPKMGSVGGGTLVTVTGEGFYTSVDKWEGSPITIAGKPCSVKKSSSDKVVCMTSAGTDNLEGNVEMTVNSVTASSSDTFKYDPSLSPQLQSFSPTSGTVKGGGNLTLTGSNFGIGAYGTVKIGNAACEIVAWSDKKIICTIPPVMHGDHEVIVDVPAKGFAKNSGGQTFSVNFKITNMSPKVGSTLGGTKVKITGLGFDDCSDLKIKLGEKFECMIDTCKDTEIFCTTKLIPITHIVTNGGTHPRFGLGYMWDPPEISILPGDSIQWRWSVISKTSVVGINVFETNEKSDEYNGIGFNSGEKKSSGIFTNSFVTPGSYYYSSDPVEYTEPIMRGKIIVKEGFDKDFDSELSVSVGEIDAFHDTSATSTEMLNIIDDCTITEAFDCSSEPSITDTFKFKSALCLTPKVTKVEITSGQLNNSISNWITDNAELTFTGEGFSTQSCQNSVKLGNDHSCSIKSVSSTSIVCNLNANTENPLPSLRLETLSLNVMNKGYSLLALNILELSKMMLFPVIDNINRAEGSWTGGNILKLTGTGLLPYGGKKTVRVIFGEEGFQAECTILEVTYTEINCLIPDYRPFKGVDVDKKVPVIVLLGFKQLMPKSTVTLEYTFKTSLISTADTISSTSVSAGTTLTISGTNFGNLKGSIKIFAKKPGTLQRRRRSVPELDIVKENIPKAEDRWKKLGAKVWRCPGKGLCNTEEVTSNIEKRVQTRRKRSILDRELKESLEEDKKTTFEICKEFPNECYLRLMKTRETSQSRKKRSSDEDLLEMSPLAEDSFQAEITSVTDTSIELAFENLPAGDYEIIVNIDGASGNSVVNFGTLTSVLSISSVSPMSGSLHGGHLVLISGSGFSGNKDDTQVSIGTSSCSITESTPSMIKCVTEACTDSCGTITVVSNGESDSTSYVQDVATTPVLSAVTSSSANKLVVSGSKFGSDPKVFIGTHECSTDSASATEITCTIPSIPGGEYSVLVNNPDFGDSNSDKTYTIDLLINSLSPATGSYGGGTEITIDGSGFADKDSIILEICENQCNIVSASATEIKCLTPANDGSTPTQVCDLLLHQSSGNLTKSGLFTYDSSLTPVMESVSPNRGGTGGGTLLTITGSGFSNANKEVTIDGSVCEIATESDTEITCYTSFHNGAYQGNVIVAIEGKGFAKYKTEGSGEFYYIDRWSSKWTWGGLGTPLEGEFIVISPGMTILLDVDTPVLKFLLINGGTLLFDEEKADLELQSEYILIVGGGSLKIGTEDKPYESNAVITMHGNVRCTEMPVFGCKVIGVREGSLDLHGKYIPVTWTHLAQTAEPDDKTITLKQPVTWKSGDHIAIATTSDRSSMKENEENYIESVSSDGLTLTLKNPLKYRHISIEQTFDGKTVETRGEVALLNRNVLVRGTVNEQFITEIPACEEEFNSGAAFSDAMQTCFAGKFGEEIGTDEMGAVIIISPQFKDQGLVSARFSYVELTSVGQAFRVGRYPIHFHLPGNQNTSYIRGVAVHHSNNRACTLHDVSNMVVEHNVAYNIKGLTFFLEDGVEMHNTIQYNVAIFTRMSNSLLNPDINPASFWIVNPMNKFRHNACAGGTHHCFWLRPARVPDGPSWVRKFCPFKVPFEEFHNNTAHSMGWYGFWIFGQSNHVKYDPHSGSEGQGYCNGNRIQARIGSFTTWNNKRGFEIVSGANIRMENQTHMDHDFSAYEIFTAKGPAGPDGAGIFNSLIVGHSKVSELTGKGDMVTPAAIHLPLAGYTLQDVTFVNFDSGSGGYALGLRFEEPGETTQPVRVSGLKFINTAQRQFTPEGQTQGIHFRDVDGSLTGTPNTQLVSKSATNPPQCVDDPTGNLGGGVPSSICDESITFHRITIESPAPTSLLYNKVVVSNKYGSEDRVWMDMFEGWQALLPQGPLNKLTFDTVEHLVNISYKIEGYGMHQGENYLLLGHDLFQQPDRFKIIDDEEKNSTASLESPPTFDTAENGDWFFNNETGNAGTYEMQYILSSKGSGRKNNWRKRSTVETLKTGDEGVWPVNDVSSGIFSVIQCESEGCIPKPPPTMDPTRPESFITWSEPQNWLDANLSTPTGDEVIIPRGAWVVLDENPQKLKRLYVYGTLEVPDTEDRKLEVEIFLIIGGRFIVGDESTPFEHNFELHLHGNHTTTAQSMFNAPNLGAKALGVYGDSIRTSVYPGLLDLHGKDIGKSWVKLAATAKKGTSMITLSEDVTWKAGDNIVITATNYEPLETERRTIQSISGRDITLDTPLDYDHLSVTESLSDNSLTYDLQAEVGVLTRNVKIIGANYPDQEEEMFGARVIAAAFEEGSFIKPGFARISNVEFVRAGQEGWSDNYDPRYSLAFINSRPEEFELLPLGELTSYVKKCGFDYNYNSAIGVFKSEDVAVEDNVIYRHINDGILDESKSTKITRNLVALGESINEIKELQFAFVFKGCINIQRGTKTILQDNVMAGCVQGGLVTRGSPCDLTYTWSNNEIHSTVHAVHLNNRGLEKLGCVHIKNFYAWRNYDYGLMSQSSDNVKIENLTLVENGVGVMTHSIGPSAVKHEIEDDKHVSIKKSTIVGNSAAYECANDDPPRILSFTPEKKRGWTEKKKGYAHTAVVFPIFQSAFVKITLKWHQALVSAEGSNPALRGIMEMDEVTFANFDGKCSGKKDTVFRTNIAADDMNWPIRSSKLKFIDVEEKNKVLYDRPLASKINPADCTDFDCDGMKKTLFIDKDGTLIGESGGTVIPDSAYEWDGNPQNGLGYYRVPLPMVTELNGDRIPYSDKMPNTGIIRDSQCNWIEDWTAYKCHGINHKLLIIESMDRDSRIRRLSPIAMLSDKYIDLINGPQDISCCQGYTCAERLSTFYTMVATNKEYELFMTSIPPQKFKFHLLHNEENEPVKIKMWFPKQQRLDIYLDGRYIPPKNKDFSNVESHTLLPPNETYIPKFTDVHCSNYFDPNTGHLYIIVREKQTCDITTVPVVVLKIGILVSEEDFFDTENIVNNIAGLIGIPASKIRVTNIVREGSTGKKKRSTDDEEPGIEFEISENPSQELDEDEFNEPLPTYTTPANPNDPTQNPLYTTTPGTTSTTTTEFKVPQFKLTYEALQTIKSKVSTAVQTGELGKSLNATVTKMEISEPIPPPKEEPPYTSPEERAAILPKTFAEATFEADSKQLEKILNEKPVKVPSELSLKRNIYKPQEMAPMDFYPYLVMKNNLGEDLEVVGGPGDPWIVTASLIDGPTGATLEGGTTAPFVEGFANFTDLAFSKEGSGYRVRFELTYPDNLNIPAVDSRVFETRRRPLGIVIENIEDQVPEAEVAVIKFSIYDLGLKQKASAEVLAGLTWECALSWSINTPVEITGNKTSSITQGNTYKNKTKNQKTW